MDIFTSFPNAIVTDVWELGTVSRSTEVGKSYEKLGYIDCIVDEEVTGGQNNSPSADYITSQTMLFVKPEALAQYNIGQMVANFMIKNTETDQLYEITGVGVGQNQETGVVEHLELLIQPTEAIEEDE